MRKTKHNFQKSKKARNREYQGKGEGNRKSETNTNKMRWYTSIQTLQVKGKGHQTVLKRNPAICHLLMTHLNMGTKKHVD